MVALGGVKGRRPSLAGYQENFAGAPRPRKASGTPAEHLKSSYPAIFAGGRSRPEASESIKTRR